MVVGWGPVMNFPTPKLAWLTRKPDWEDSAKALIEKCKEAVMTHERGYLYVDIEDGTNKEAVDHAISVIEEAGWKATFRRDRNGGHTVVRANADGSYSPVPIVACLEIHESRPCQGCDWGSGATGYGPTSRRCMSCHGSKTV